MPTTPGRPRSVSTPTWNATASSSLTRPPSTASSTASSPGTERSAAPAPDIRIGCSGWNYASWRASFYPPRTPTARWLEHYARVFDTVEVNSTFYRLAKRDAVARWVEQTPPGFVFAVKSSQYLTHMKRLTDMERGVERLYEPLQPLVEAGKLGPVLWQLPERFARDDERLAFALDRLPPGRHAFEFRHPSWFTPDVYALLRERDVAFVNAHRRGKDLPRDVVTADFTFLRFHHGDRGRRGNYSATELDEWAARVVALARQQLDGFAYFNNDWEDFAPGTAVGLRKRVTAALGLRPSAPGAR
jgi:uncharacterized protein YecE (DUF72 family)